MDVLRHLHATPRGVLPEHLKAPLPEVVAPMDALSVAEERATLVR